MEWNVIGHEWAARLLQQHIANGEARHAYLFTGPAGIGRRTLALRFAQALNCANPPAPGLPCGACRACQQIERQQHTDLAVQIARESGLTIGFGSWLVAASVPALAAIALLPLLVAWLFPPGVRKTPDAPAAARRDLTNIKK